MEPESSLPHSQASATSGLFCRQRKYHACKCFVTIRFLLCGVVSLTPNPQPGGPGYPFLSGLSPLTCLAWEALPVAYATASIALGIMWPQLQLQLQFAFKHLLHLFSCIRRIRPILCQIVLNVELKWTRCTDRACSKNSKLKIPIWDSERHWSGK
jgi:hypothetical protein